MTRAIGCAKTIEPELTDLDGVQTATVDFDKKPAIVTFDKTTPTPESLTKEYRLQVTEKPIRLQICN